MSVEINKLINDDDNVTTMTSDDSIHEDSLDDDSGKTNTELIQQIDNDLKKKAAEEEEVEKSSKKAKRNSKKKLTTTNSKTSEILEMFRSCEYLRDCFGVIISMILFIYILTPKFIKQKLPLLLFHYGDAPVLIFVFFIIFIVITVILQIVAPIIFGKKFKCNNKNNNELSPAKQQETIVDQ